MKEVYIATVQIVIDVDSQAEAIDWINEGLRESDAVDWGFPLFGGQRLTPTPINVDLENYEEGDAFALA